jgi:DNA-binding transcriptional ArsR family regulator
MGSAEVLSLTTNRRFSRLSFTIFRFFVTRVIFERHAVFGPYERIGLPYITPYGVDQLTHVLTAISHPTRRAIIGQLASGPARFLDIAEPFGTALNATTKHLKILERAGLIERQKQGREVLISFRGEPLSEVAGWMHRYERFWNERLDQFERHFRNKRKKENRR